MINYDVYSSFWTAITSNAAAAAADGGGDGGAAAVGGAADGGAVTVATAAICNWLVDVGCVWSHTVS